MRRFFPRASARTVLVAVTMLVVCVGGAATATTVLSGSPGPTPPAAPAATPTGVLSTPTATVKKAIVRQPTVVPHAHVASGTSKTGGTTRKSTVKTATSGSSTGPSEVPTPVTVPPEADGQCSSPGDTATGPTDLAGDVGPLTCGGDGRWHPSVVIGNPCAAGATAPGYICVNGKWQQG